MDDSIAFTISFAGNASDYSKIDFYDVGKALIGFQRSLALTTHLVLNGDVITQAPYLTGAEIFAQPPEQGSWKFTAVIAVSIYSVTSAPSDSVLGHIMKSGYDYVISQSLGFHVDFDKTLGQQYEEYRQEAELIPAPRQSKFDSVIEKCESSIREMHRPIVMTETANSASLVANISGKAFPLSHSLNQVTFEYINETITEEEPIEVSGFVTSYDSNTYKGRIFIPEENRAISFELSEQAQSIDYIDEITSKLNKNAVARLRFGGPSDFVTFIAYEKRSRAGRLKGLYVIRLTGPD